MPELPEVECYRRKLAPIAEGRVIERVWASGPSYAFLTPPQKLRRLLEGARIERIERRAKYLLFHLIREKAEAGALLLHLGMTGQVYAAPRERDKHVHLILTLSGTRNPLVFRDPRKFGKLAWLPPGGAEREPRLTKLGPDALGLTGDGLFAAARGRKIAIKALLLDQSVVAGAGNIYADEALFAAGMRPMRAGGRITRGEAKMLADALRAVLRRAIKAGGSSISDYIHPDGERGYFQIQHRVYGREGKPCPVCGTPIKRMTIGQRSAHYCPRCQK